MLRTGSISGSWTPKAAIPTVMALGMGWNQASAAAYVGVGKRSRYLNTVVRSGVGRSACVHTIVVHRRAPCMSEVSTCWPSPVISRARRAALMPHEAR